METTLLLLHTEKDGSLGKTSLEAVSAAATLAPDAFMVGLVGEDVRAAADHLAGCRATRVLGVSGSEFGMPRYATDSAAAEALIRASGTTLVLAPATSRWSRVLAGVSERLGGKIDTHATVVEAADGAVHVTRWFYRQRMMGTLTRTARPWIVTLDPGVAAPWQGASGVTYHEAVSIEMPEVRTTVEGVQAPPGSQQTIRPDAPLLFVAGAGWTKKQSDGQPHVKDAEGLILGFLDKSQASLGSSKSLVDLSGEGQEVLTFMSHLNQVGQTGSTPRHPKGLSTCCHGEEPHVVGWRFINERRAINLDAGCGWAQGKADVLYVADAFEVMKKVNELL